MIRSRSRRHRTLSGALTLGALSLGTLSAGLFSLLHGCSETVQGSGGGTTPMAGQGGESPGAGGIDAGGFGAGGTGGGETGGNAGATITPPEDIDGDGFTEDEGDCNDDDAEVYPGRKEICGDLVDNDCSDGPDDICEGLGTFVSVKTGSDDNPGTIDEPVKTIARGMENAAEIGGDLTVYVADGVYEVSDLELVESVSLAGGYQCDAGTCDFSRDASTCLTIVRPEDPRGVFADETITRATRVDGFAIEGASGASVVGGRQAVTIDGGTPVVSNNCIVGPDATSGTGINGRTIGVRLVMPLNDENGVLLESNEILAGDSTSADSLGINVDQSTATDFGVVHLHDNHILGGSGVNVLGVASAGAGEGSRFESNRISGGVATNVSWAIQLTDGNVVIDGNRLNADADHLVQAGAAGTWIFNGGVQLLNASGTIVNNLVYGANAKFSAGVSVRVTNARAAEVNVHSNTVFGTFPEPAAPLVVAAGLALLHAVNNEIHARGLVRNNIFIVEGATTNIGVFESGPNDGTTGYYVIHPEAFENNIIWGPPSGTTLYSRSAWEQNTSLTTEAAINQANIAVTVGGNLWTDPKVNDDGEIGLGSLARDNGTSTGAPDHDIHGDSRPLGDGYDIGADESN